MSLTVSLKTSLCHYFISRAHTVIWLHHWFQGKRFMCGLRNCISSPPWYTLLFLHLELSQASPLLFLSHASSANLHIDYFPPPSQARSNSALVHLAMYQNSCSWQADKSCWFSTSICSFATAFSSGEQDCFFVLSTSHDLCGSVFITVGHFFKEPVSIELSTI